MATSSTCTDQTQQSSEWGKLICATGESSANCAEQGYSNYRQISSTNGTVLNNSKITNGQRKKVAHNDCIHLVNRKKHPENNIAFVFQDLELLEEELQQQLENTQEYNEVTDEETDEDTTPIKTAKRRHAQLSISDSPAEPDTKRPHLGTGDETDGQESQDKNTSDSQPIPKLKAHDSIAETLLCSICQDIFHDCISLQPCMHSFVPHAILSGWMFLMNAPQNKVEKISRNHIVNNLVEAYLKEHPERKRSEEELKEMDKKNKITSDMVQPKCTKRNSSYYDDDDDDDDDDSSGSSGSDSGVYDHSFVFGLPNPFHSGIHPTTFAGLFGFRQASSRISSVCRQCPGYSAGCSGSYQAGTSSSCLTSSSSAASTSKSTDTLTDSSSSTADDAVASSSTLPSPPTYVCPPGGSHIMCLCCSKPMPQRHADRSSSSATAEDIPPIKCSVCKRAFCHMYWGCRAPECSGCLNKFKDMNFSDKCLNTLINNSAHESEIFQEYIKTKTLGVKDVLQNCLEKLDTKEYKCVDSGTFDLTSETVLCYRCGIRNFQNLSYQFRRDVPNDDLPDEVTNRPDCYWGKNCRTQRTRPHHALRFNHICEQTRFT